MANAFIPKAFRETVVQLLLDGFGNWYVELFTNVHTPDEDDVPSDYTFASYSTYVQQMWALSAPSFDLAGRAIFDTYPARFPAPAVGDGDSYVRGFVVKGIYGDNPEVVVMAQEFGSPVLMNAANGDLLFDISFADWDANHP